MPHVLIYTLGCKLNQLESESYIDEYLKAGYKTGDDNPSVIIINTCTVTSKADQKARRVIRKALRDYPCAAVIVTGCYAALDKKTIENLFLTETQRIKVLKREDVFNFLRTSGKKTVSDNNNFQFFPEKFSYHTRAFLKIQDGCDNCCTYCRIRLARGNSVSLPAEQVLERLKILETKHAEAVLTGVNICQYQDNKFNREPARIITKNEVKNNLFVLIEYLLKNTDKIAIRLSSLDPQYIDDNFVKVLAHKRIRPHFHLSVQSCSESILKRMGRSYNARTIAKAAELLRAAKDDPFLACDIITGFPGETEKEFNETYELCKKMDFAWIHVFPYSKRPQTPAAEFKDSVKESEVTKRVKLLTDLAVQGKRDYIRRWTGREAEVLIESGKKKVEIKKMPAIYGVSDNYLKVLVACGGELPPPGTVVMCKLVKEVFLKTDFAVEADVIGTF